MSDSSKKACRSLIVVLCAVLASTNAAAGEGYRPEVSLSVDTCQNTFLVGEPLQVHVRLRWLNPVPDTVVVSAEGFLEMRMAHDGEMMVTPSHMLDQSFASASWEENPVHLTINSPVWQQSLRMGYLFDLRKPGDYEVWAEWTTPTPRDEEKAKILGLLGEQHRKIVFAEGHVGATHRGISLVCPRTKEDKEVFSLLAGGQCPGRSISEPALISFAFKDEERILDEYPQTTYAAYLIHEMLPNLEDWRIESGNPADSVRNAIGRGPIREFSKQTARTFGLVERNLRGGNTPGQLKVRLWEYYGEELLVRGRLEEARAAFRMVAAASCSQDTFYSARARQYLEALATEGDR